MKNLTVKLSLMALVVLVISSCKPKIDADFVNSVMGLQTKITESVSALKGSTASMESYKGLMMKQAAEMAGSESASSAQELVGAVSKVLGDRANMLTTISGMSSRVGDLLAKYKAGGIKLKDAKSQFATVQGDFNDVFARVADSDKQFTDIKSKFGEMYKMYKAASGK